MKPLKWVGSSLSDLQSFPKLVRVSIGYALDRAQRGGKVDYAKPLKGFGGAGVLEVIEDYQGDTYRAVYTVRLKDVVYVLHAFKKKSKHGIATPKGDMDLVRERLKRALSESEDG